MSKLALGLLAVGIMGMPFIEKGEKPEMAAQAYSDVALDVVGANGNVVYIAQSQTGATCKVVQEIEQGKQALLKSDRTCASVYEGLERVTRWVAGEHGNDALQDAAGKTILVVGPSDGFAFEAVTKDGAMISFALSDV